MNATNTSGYKMARRLAEIDQETLREEFGVDFEIEVWQNLGYHYSLVLGTMYIYPPKGKSDTYTMLIGDGKHKHVGMQQIGAIKHEDICELVKLGMKALEAYRTKIDGLFHLNATLLTKIKL